MVMDKHESAAEIRAELLAEYYSKIYQSYLFNCGSQGKGIDYFEKAVEKFWLIRNPGRVLEIGGGSGEHLKYLNYIPLEEYISIDVREPFTLSHTKDLPQELLSKVKFMIGNAESLQFPDFTFDRVYTTCLLHHVDDVLAVLMEARRVTKEGGEIAFIVPTDPGILNQFVKRMISYPKLRRLTKVRPELFYALDHKNHVGSILELIRFVFSKDDLKFHYRPFRLESWNLNLLVVAKVTKKA
jgi:ubiquinone/menaquinone biosynthesis C-methylase UbiE